MWCGRRLWLGLVAVIALGACDRIEQTTLDDSACQVLCECSGSILPGAQRECMSSCLDQLPGFTPECLECIGQASCSQLGADACDDVCF